MINRLKGQGEKAWEMLHNPAFKDVEFDTFLHDAHSTVFKLYLITKYQQLKEAEYNL